MKTEDINLKRQEIRLFLVKQDVPFLVETIKPHLSQEMFSANEVVQTVYFMDDEQSLPWGISLKARRYLSDFGQGFKPTDKFLVDFKQKSDNGNMYLREKTPRQEMSLSETAEAFFRQTGCLLRPYLLIEYRRRHFLPKDGSPLRLTLDDNIFYFFIEKDNQPVFLGEEKEIVRVECKIGDQKNELARHLISFLAGSLKALPIISKKEMGLNLTKRWRDKVSAKPYPLIKELKDCEIEAKLTFDGINPVGFFVSVKDFWRQGAPSFVLPAHHPFTFTTSSVNHYWGEAAADKPKEAVKFLFKGDEVRPVLKKGTELIDAGAGIVKRQEKKEEKFYYSPSVFAEKIEHYRQQFACQLKYRGYLIRGRKAIWVEHRETNRVYHISLDKCLAPDKQGPFYQFEIEYSGRHQGSFPAIPPTAEKEIIKDTKFLAGKILAIAKSKSGQVVLKPEGLSKIQWLTET